MGNPGLLHFQYEHKFADASAEEGDGESLPSWIGHRLGVLIASRILHHHMIMFSYISPNISPRQSFVVNADFPEKGCQPQILFGLVLLQESIDPAGWSAPD
jgi:hypothetical protein